MTHSQSKGIHFFKVILERTLQTGELQVPRSFVKRHWQGISTPAVSLRLPNSTEFKVYWLKRGDGDVYFRNGWKEFAEHVSLEASQFVVFRYEGNSIFNVIVLGKTALEIEYPAKGNSTLEEQEEEEEECKEVHESDYCFKEGKKRKPASPSCSLTSKKMKTTPKVEEHDASFYNAKNWNGASCDRELKKRIEALVEKVKNHHSESHTFICAIRNSYIERDLLNIPKDFARQHLHKMEGEMATLFVDNKDRTWDVELKIYGVQLTFANGWRDFLTGNNLNLGDVCAFVLDHNNNNKSNNGVSFKVVVYPLQKYSSTLLFQGLSQRPSSSLKAPKTRKVESKYTSEDGFNIHIKIPMSTVSIPISYMRKFVSKKDHGKNATLRVGNNKWTVKVLYYEHNFSSRFSHGWTEFVKGCNLKDGDVCHFKMIDVKNLELQVTIN